MRLVMAFLLLSAGAAQAQPASNWRLVTMDKDSLTFQDTDRQSRQGDTASVWSLSIFRLPQVMEGKKSTYWLVHSEYYCSTGKVRYISMAAYTNNHVSVKSIEFGGGVFHDVVPESNADADLKAACEGKFIADYSLKSVDDALGYSKEFFRRAAAISR